MQEAGPETAVPQQPDGPKPEDRLAPRYQPLVIVLAAVCTGIVAERFYPIPVFACWTAAVVALVVWFCLWRRHRERTAAVLLMLAVAATAASWHHCRWRLFAADELGRYARAEVQPVCVEAVALTSARVVHTPKNDPMRAIPTSARSRVDLKLTGLRDGARWRKVSGRTTLHLYDRPPDVRPGDRLRIFGQFSAPPVPHNPGQHDYATHLRADRRLGRLRTAFAECVSVVALGSGFRPWRLIELARSHGDRILRRHINPRRAALASAVLLGARERIDPEQKRAFRETGTIHLLAISGLHVGIMACALMFVLRRLPISPRWAVFVLAVATVFYMLLTDARPPVVRATILVLVFCGSVWLGRRHVKFNSLAAAGLIVLAVNPADLFQTGPQLSFLCVAGIMYFSPKWIDQARKLDPLQRLIERHMAWPSWLFLAVRRSLRHLILISAMLWLLLLPLLMARFHLFTPVAVILNTLLWLPMAAALWFGFATLAFGTLWAPLGMVFGACCNAMLWVLQSSVDLVQGIPYSHIWAPGPADWWLVGFYGTIAIMAAAPRLRPPRRWCLALAAGWVAVGFAAAGMKNDRDRLQCTFLSMGHGCAVVLELPSGQTLLYDAGQFSSPTSGSRSIAGYLWSQGITHIDAVVLSHGDLDHYNAMPELLERFSVGVIYVSPFMFENPNLATEALCRAIDRSGVPMREIHGGRRLSGGEGCRIEVLHPPRRGVLGSDNTNSIVLSVEYLGRRILLTGDLESPGTEYVLAEEPLDCDVLMAPHHGSRRSNPPGLARWCTPEWVVVSGSRRWPTAEIEQTYRAVGSRVLHTARHGAVSVTVDTNGISVESFLSP